MRSWKTTLLFAGCMSFLIQIPYTSAQAQDNAGVAESADQFLEKQDADPQVQAKQPVNEKSEEAEQENKNQEILEQKIALAKKMHELNPTSLQVDSAIMKASQSLAPQERKAFIASMRSVLNYNAIERISIDAMVKVYTLKELDAMVEYYSKPEAKSASAKMGQWAALVQPEIVRMIDKAMMKVRLGEP